MAGFIEEIRDEDLGGWGITDLLTRANGHEMDRILSGNGDATGEMIIRTDSETVDASDARISSTLAQYLSERSGDSVNRLLVAASESSDLTGADRGAFYFMSIMNATGANDFEVPAQIAGDDPVSVYARRVAGTFSDVDARRQNRVADFFTPGWLDRQGIGGAEYERIDRIGEYFVERIRNTADVDRAAEFDKVLAELGNLENLNNTSIGTRLQADLTRELYSAAVYLLPPPDLAVLSTREDLDPGVRDSIQKEVATRLEAASDQATDLGERETIMLESLLERAYEITDNGPAEGVTIDGELSSREIELINQIGQELADGKLPTDSWNPFNKLRDVRAPEDVNLVDGVDPGEAGRIVAAAIEAQRER